MRQLTGSDLWGGNVNWTKKNNVLMAQIMKGTVYGEAGFRSYC